MIKFETINGTLCRMVEPTPLTPEANFPCVVRLIQDDSPMGRSNDFYATSHLLAHIEIVNGLDAIHFVRWQGSKTHYSRFEIIGYPVADGSLEWALYQIRSGKKVVKEGGGEQYCSSLYKNRLFYLNDYGCFVTKNAIGLIDPCSEKEFLDLDKTGWQLYEPQPEPKPEHPAINGYNRYDYIPVEGIRQPKPEPEPAFKVGDWVEFRDIEGIKHGIIEGRREEYSVLCNGISQSVGDKFITRKLDPSEVVLDFGNGIKGKVCMPYPERELSVLDDNNDWIAQIAPDALDAPMRKLVKALLKAQGGE